MNESRRYDGRETWNRLLQWDKGQSSSERLAGVLLATEGFSNLDPSHPLGGKDGTKDALLEKDDLKLVLAVYFPRGQHGFREIKEKFTDDLGGVAKNGAEGFVFFTNQELRLAERSELTHAANGIPVEIYHLERVALLLNTPRNYGTRLEFLQIAMTNEELIALYSQRDKEHLAQLAEITESLTSATRQIIGHTTGGDSYPMVFIRSIALSDSPLLEVHVHVEGDFPIYEASFEVVYLENPVALNAGGKIDPDTLKRHQEEQAKRTFRFDVGNMSPKYFKTIGHIPPPQKFPVSVSINAFTRNAVFNQFLQLDRNDNGQVATSILKITNDPKHQNVIHEWRAVKKKPNST